MVIPRLWVGMCLRQVGAEDGSVVGRVSAQLLAILKLYVFFLSTYGGSSSFAIGKIITKTSNRLVCLRGIKVSGIIALSSVGLTPNKGFGFARGHPRCPSFCHLHLGGRLVGFTISSARAVSFITSTNAFTASCSIRKSRGSGTVGTVALTRLSTGRTVDHLQGRCRSGVVSSAACHVGILTTTSTCGRITQGCVCSTPVSATTCFTLFRRVSNLLFFSLCSEGSIGTCKTITADCGRACPRDPHSGRLCGLALRSVGILHTRHPISCDGIRAGRVSFLSVRLPSIQNRIMGLSAITPNGIILVGFATCRAR